MKRNILFFAFLLLFSKLSSAQEILEDKSYLKTKTSHPSFTKQEEELELNGQIAFTSLNRALANKDIVKKLNLANQGLSEFPVELLMLHSLEYLDLSGNSISEIPSAIAQLTHLKVLALSKNQLSTLPSAIGDLSKLEVLLIENNRKQFVLPASMSRLSHLKKIWCSDVVNFPSFFWNMASIEDARLWSVNLQTVPSDIKNMINLKEICFKGNSLSSLPAELFTLPNLTYLNLGNNNFTAIPTDINKLTKLDYLGVYGNPIKSLILDDNMFKHLRFLAAWKTSLPSSFAFEVEQKSLITKVNLTGKDLH